MQEFAGRRLRRFFWNASRAGLGWLALAGLALGVAQAQPANDDFANAINLTGDSGSTTGSNVGATIQSGEQNVGAFAGSVVASVWYKWTASTNETTEFDPTGSSFGTNLTIVQVFSSTNASPNFASLQWVAYGYYGFLSGVFFDYTNSFQAVAGQTYYISVAGYQFQNATGSVQLNWSSSPPLAPPPNDNFANATVLTGAWGSTNADNTLATRELNEPSHAGFPANHSVWYQWTAPADGEVTLDTVGSGSGVDTVLAVYTGASLGSLNQIAANDDLFPVNSALPTIDATAGGTDFSENRSWDIIPTLNVANNLTITTNNILDLFQYLQPYYGPSGLRFNAKGGTTYFFAVDAKGFGGPIALNWAYKSSGVFRWASEDEDALGTGLPIYKTADIESVTPNGNNNSALSAVSTYYSYNAPGVLVTVTRTAGSSGRAMVDYQTVDGDKLPPGFSLPSLDVPAHAGDYTPANGTLIFDDFEMSKTILIHINGSADNLYNSYFGLVLSNPRLDPNESSGVSAPRVDPKFGVALVEILNTTADPEGPDYIQQIITNSMVTTSNSVSGGVTNVVTVTNFTYFTNLVVGTPTNNLFNFEKANYRVPADVNGTNSPWAQVTLWVERTGTNYSAETINWRANNFVGVSQPIDDEYNAFFPLQPGSDYAVPTPPTNNVFNGRNSDFNLPNSGTLSFPASPDPAYKYQPLTFTVPVSSLTKFNKDFKIQLYRVRNNATHLVGMNAETTVTILFNDLNPPAGSVDQLYNADFNSQLALPPQMIPQTWPVNNLNNPGVSGQVYGLVVLPNDETIIAGNFASYNGVGQNNLALLNKDGSLDTSFNPGDSANAAINAVAISGNQFIIGGSFTAYAGTQVGYFARVNADGSLDTAFSTAQGSGANGIVRAVAVQPDDKVIIGGDFTSVDGVPRNHLARLNADGSLDTSFDPGATLDGPVYSLTMAPAISFGPIAGNTPNESDQVVSFPAFTSGVLTVNYNFGITNNDLRVFYGNTNVAAGTGVLIFDTGPINGAGTLRVPVGPVGGLTANFLTIVMNQGGSTNPAVAWSYSGVFRPFSDVVAGGQFDVAGQSYANIAAFNTSGALDPAFDPGTGPDNKVLALAMQMNQQVIAGGVFTHVNGFAYNRIVRFNGDGSIDTTNFFVGTGADDVVYNLTLVPTNGMIYVGGQFASFNGTHRLGFTRLYPNGTVDTTFMDTAFNQFAGLKRIYSYDLPGVYASGVQSDGNVMIGGSFNQVGGGEANPNVCNTLDDEMGLFGFESFADPNLWVEPKARDGVRNRSSVARLIGGSTPGPGNLGFVQNSYSANKSQSSLSVNLVRTNGNLGPVSANFSVLPGLAQSGSDYFYNGAPPMFWIDWIYRKNPAQSRMHEDGLSGINGFLVDPYGLFLSIATKEKALNKLSLVNVSIIKNTQVSGNLNAQFQLANPPQADQFYLGGENIPLGTALGVSSAPLTIVDDTQKPGVFGFSSPVFIGTSASVPISVLRSNGVAGSISVRYSTISSNSTAVVGADYVGLTNAGPLVFNQNVVSNGFAVTVLNHGIIYTNQQEKTVYLRLSSLGTTPPGATYGISNALLRLINPNYQGYVTLAATNFSAAESSGSLAFVVNRVGGDLGSVSVQYATTDGPSATNGVDYVGSSGTLNWDSGDVSQKILNVPLIQTYTVGASRQFGVTLFNPKLGSTNTPSLMGSFSNAVCTIINDNSYGTLQFSAPSYLANENGGYATITVLRVGGNAGTISAHYFTSDGTATAGTNYLAVSGTVTLAPGQTTTNFTVPILNDGVVDPPLGSFYFNVSLQGPGTLVSSVVQIVDVQTYNRPPGSPDTGFVAAGFNGNVFTLALQPGGQILAGGNFTDVGTTAEGSFARLNPDGSLDTTFLSGLAGANGPVQSIVCQTDGRILVGGAFSSINGVFRHFIARVMTDGSLDTSFNPGPGADNAVNAIAETFIGGARKIYVGGAFGNISSASSPGLARLNNDGSYDSSFSVGSGADGPVFAVAVYPTNSLYAGKVLVGGGFKHFNGTPLNGLARLNADGSLDTNFNNGFGLGAAGAVRALAIQLDGRVLVGGSFTNFNGAPSKFVVRLNPDGTVDSSFAANTSDAVEGMALQSDDRIVLVGAFTQANNVTRNHITRLLPTGATDPTINFGAGANGDVDTVVVQPADGMLVIGGNFSQYDDQPHANIARIYGGSVTGSGQFEFTSANYQVHETGAFAQITIRRTGGTSGTNAIDGSGDISVNFATTTGTAVSNVNYTPVNQNVDFPPGEVLRTVTVPVMDDGIITPNLTVGLALSNPTPAGGLGTQPTANLTIINDDSGVNFSSTFYTVLKNTPNGAATIDIIRQGGTNNTSTVGFYTTTNGTAIAGTDYVPTNVLVTFNPGVTDVPVSLAVINNGLAEGNQTVGLALTNGSNTILLPPTNATLTIIDTTAAPGRLSFSATNYVVSAAGTNAVLTIVRTNGSVGTVSVSFTAIPGTALPGVNYNPPTSTNVTFLGGETVKTILVQLVNNQLVQPPVSFSVVLSNPTGGATLANPTNTTVTILNNNFGASFLNGTNYVSETNSPGLIFVQRLGNPTNTFTVDYATTNGTALAGVNYTTTTGTLAFASGELVKTISVPLINQHLTTNRVFGMALLNPANGAQLVAPSNTLIVVQGGIAGLSFTNSATSVLKNAGHALIPVVCSNPGIEPVIVDSNTVPLSVQYYTVDGTAVNGQDYTGVSGTLVFTNGIGTNNIRIPILNNTLITGQRTLTVVLTNATAPGQITSPSNQVVTIIDSNAGLSFSNPYYTVNKTNVTATIMIVRTDNTNQVSTVNFSATNGTAVAGIDYVATNGTVVFTNGVTSQSFTVTVIAGTTVQPDKTVLLQLSSPGAGSFLAPPSAAVLTIHDTSGSLVVPAGSAFAPNGDPNQNGLIDPNETVTLLFAFRAAGGISVTNLSATLLATNGVTAPSPATPVSYGQLNVGGPPAYRMFTFTANGTNSQLIAATFLLTNGTTSLGTALFTYTLGTWTTVFYNTNPIVINAAGPAAQYPSAITVSNVGGVLLKTTVTLTNMTHTAPAAINALLVSPNQNDTLLMSHVGGGQFGGAINGVTLGFDDTATNSLPFNGQITNGVYKPSQYGGTPVFP